MWARTRSGGELDGADRSRSAGGRRAVSRSKSFITRRLADSYRAELVRAAWMMMGLEFDPLPFLEHDSYGAKASARDR